MAKLITVDRVQLERSCRKMKKLLAKDPSWQETQKEIKRYGAREKARRDAEYRKSRKGAVMDLQPLFSLRPLSPLALTYDPAIPTAAWALAFFESSGGITHVLPLAGVTLGDQNNRDEIALGDNPMKVQDQDLFAFPRYCLIWVYFIGKNVSKNNQYLLLFALRRIYGSPWAQIFIGTDFLTKVKINGDEQVAILLDSPGDGIPITLAVRLATDKASYHAGMGFKGMQCYLL